MKKYVNKTISFLLTIVLLTGLLGAPTSVQAEDGTSSNAVTVSTQMVEVNGSTQVTASDMFKGDYEEKVITSITAEPDSSVASVSLSNNGRLVISGVDTGTTSVMVEVSDGTNTVEVVVPIKVQKKLDFYFGIDIKNGMLQNEENSVVTSSYKKSGTGDYQFEKDGELNQTVLCGPVSGNLAIDSLNLASLNSQFAVEAYINISSSMSAYDAFQFTGQNINLVGVPGATYFGAGRCSVGDADVYTNKSLPTDQWIHVICTAKEGKQTLYVNGVEFATNTYTGLNLTSTGDNELVLGGTSAGRSGLIKYASLRIYRNFVTDNLAQDMYKDMKSNFVPADYTAVDGAIAKVPVDLSVYTDDSESELNTAMNAVIRGKNFPEQNLVDGYAIAIENAIRGLKIPNLFLGIDIKNGKLQNEIGSNITDSIYRTTDSAGYQFIKEGELNQTVLCGPESGNLIIDGLNLASLNKQITVEAYLNISSSMSAYDVFQFTGQNINLVGVPGATYFGAGRCSTGDADVYTNQSLPTDQWIHVICTAKEGKQMLYVNGTEFAADAYTGLNLTSTSDKELVLGGTIAGRSGLIKYAALRVYDNFVTDALAQDMYQNMKASFVPNTAPKPRNPMGNKTVILGGLKGITAADIAGDADGDTLTITAITKMPDSATATASLSDGKVIVEGVAIGSTLLSVTVSDGFNEVEVEVPIIVIQKSETSASLVVTEVQPDNAGNDHYEFFEVYNTTSQDINLTEQSIGISYYTASQNVDVVYPANTVIKAKTAVVFWLSYKNGSTDNTNLTEQSFKNYYAISGSATDTTTDNIDSEYSIVRVTGVYGLPDTGGFGIRLRDSLNNVLSESYCPARASIEDRPYEFHLSDDSNVVLLEDEVLPSPGKTVLNQNINIIYDELLSSGIQYTEKNISNYYDTGYKEHVNKLEIDLSNPNTYVLASKAYDTVNAMETIGDQAKREIGRGYNVVAGINADMYDMTTGMPISLQIRENRLIVSQSPLEEINAVRPALFIDDTNKAGIARLSSEGTVTVGSYSSAINLFNRNQDVENDIVIYTSDVASDHVLKHAYGYDEAAFVLIDMDNFSGLYPGIEYTGKVKELHNTEGFKIPDGYIVLAGYGTRASEIRALTVGSNASFSFNYCVGDEKTVKNNIQNATVMNTWLVKDGHANLEFEMTALSDYVRTANSRTAIGVKADGTLVAVTIDKPSTEYSGSVGVTMAQLAKYLRDVGCVDALNLDGGGSTEMIARKAGEDNLKTVNVPSDGSSRIVTSALLFVSKAESTGNIKNVVVDKNISIYKGSSYDFTCRLSDQAGMAVDASGKNVIWSTTFGTIDQNGHYTAPDTDGTGTVTAMVNGVSGSCTVQVLDHLASIEFTTGDHVVLDALATKQFGFLAYSDTGSEVLIDFELAKWNLSGDIGTVSPSGLVSITATSGLGVLTAEIGGQTLSAEISVGIKEQMIDGFETYPIEAYHLDGYGYGKVSQYAGSLGSSNMLSFSTDIVHSGNRSFKLDYDFSMWSRSSNGTLNLKPHWNTAIGSWTDSMAAQMAASYTTNIYPKKFGLWVYGDGKAPWLRAIMLAGDGSSKTLNLTTDTDDVNWTGWKYIEVDMPEGWQLPISLKYIYSVETDKQKNDYSGSLYFDDLRFIYTDEISDFNGPIFSDILPKSADIYEDSIDFSTVATDEISGVDKDSILIKVNNVDKSDYTYDEANGKLSFSLQNLEDGDYTIYVEAYDKAGNLSVPWIDKTYHIDTSPDTEAPVLTDVTPTSDVTVKIPTPRITFKLKDVRSTIAVENISVQLDGKELTVYYDESTGWGYAEPDTNLLSGNHVITINASDPAGNPVNYSDTIVVAPITQPIDSHNFSISIIPDTQGNTYTERIFDRAEAEDTSLVLHMGDIVDAGTQADYDTAEEYAHIFKNKPLFVAAGNHEAFLDTLDIFYKKFGSPTYHFDYGDTMIVVLNSAYGQSIAASDSTQFHYLEEVLEKNTKPNVIVVNHVITHDSFDTAHAMTSAEAMQFEAILGGYKSSHPDVEINVLFGHLHTLQSWVTDGVNYIITGNAANKNYVTYDEGSFLGSGKITVKDGRMNFSYDPYVTSVVIENDRISSNKIVSKPKTELQLQLIGEFRESPADYATKISNFDLVDIKWSSSNSDIATVDKDGLVKTLKSGTTIITATSGGKSSTVTVKVEEYEGKDPDLYFGIDINNGEWNNEAGSAVASSYQVNGDYKFEQDKELGKNVLCGPESGNLIINGLNLASLNNQFTVEAYLNISSAMSAYDAFQFTDQNINLVGVPGYTYFGAGKCSAGDADVYTNRSLPTDEWVHVVCTAKEGKQTIYVNGKEFASNTYTGLNLTATSKDELVLGGTLSGRSGLIKYASFRIYQNFIDDEWAADMYQKMKDRFTPEVTIDIPELKGVAVPVTGGKPTDTIADTSEYTAAISWIPADAEFLPETVYQATINLTPKTGYTLNGLTENYFTIPGASMVSNPANSGVITVVFPATKGKEIAAEINPSAVTYDLNAPKDVTTTILWNSAKSVALVKQGMDEFAANEIYAVSGCAITVSGSALTIQSDYLLNQGYKQGDRAAFHIIFDNNNTADLIIEIENNYVASKDATLNNLTIGGVTIQGFDPEVTEYNLELPYGVKPGDGAARAGATANDRRAEVNIVQASELPGRVIITVTAEDKATTKTYTLNLTTGTPSEQTYTLTITSGDGGRVVIGNSGSYAPGTVINIAAMPYANYGFFKWDSTKEDGSGNVYSPNTTFTMPAGDVLITAVFIYYESNPSGAGAAIGGGNNDNNDNKDKPGIDGSEVSGWNEIKNYIEENKGKDLVIEMKENTVVPASIFEAIRGEDITITFVVADGIEWVINGKDIPKADEGQSQGKDIDLNISRNEDGIPSDVMDELLNTKGPDSEEQEDKVAIPISLSYDGRFGFSATLKINLESDNAGKVAYLFYYNPLTGKLELQGTEKVDEKGNTSFEFTHASDYVILLDNGETLKAEMEGIVVQPEKNLLYAGGTIDKKTKLIIEYPEKLKELIDSGICTSRVTYKSVDRKIANVVINGEISALEEGETTITTIINIDGVEKSFQTKIQVKEAYIKLVQSKKSMKKGESYTFKAVGYGVDTDKITWKTTKKSIVVIDKKTGEAKAKKKGADYVVAKSKRVSVKLNVKVK